MLSVVICKITFSFFGVSNSLFIGGRASLSVHSDTRKLFIVVAGNVNTAIKALKTRTIMGHFISVGDDTPRVRK